MSDRDAAVAAATTLLDGAFASRFRGSDPYDGLWWSWPETLRGGRRRRQVLMQLHARSPIDFRRVYRKERPLIPKALGIFGSVGARLYAVTGEESQLAASRTALDMLDADRTAGERGWGYHWDMQTRWSFYPGGSPNVVVTAFAVDGLLDGARALDRPAFATRARSAADWVLEELFVDDGGFFAYHPGSSSVIHNANLLGARIVHELVPDAGNEAVARALTRTLDGQSADGSWPYGEGSNLRFVDSFHSGYVLDCLCALRNLDSRVEDAVKRGTEYYLERFFPADGSTPLWPDKPYPRDAHAAGTGLTTLARLVELGYAPLDVLARVARYVVDEVVVNGHAVHRAWRHGRSRVEYIRWCDAHVALGLANAARVLAPGQPAVAVGSDASGTMPL